VVVMMMMMTPGALLRAGSSLAHSRYCHHHHHPGLDRAMSTLSDQATMAVANKVVGLLSPDSVPSFYEALHQLLAEREVKEGVTTATPRGGAIDEFSKALERALDEEEGEIPTEVMVYAMNSFDVAVSSMTGKTGFITAFLSHMHP